MEESVVVALEAIDGIEPFSNPEDIASHNDFIPDDCERSYHSDSDNEEEGNFYKDEVVDVIENNVIMSEEENVTQEEPMLLTQPPLTSSRGRKNVENAPSSKFEHIKPSVMSATVDHNKVKTDALNKTKDELRKLASKFESMCSSTKYEHSVSNWNSLVADTLNSLVNLTFIQHLKSSINRVHSGDNKLKANESSA